MTKYILPNWLEILLKTYSAQVASVGIIAQFILEFGLSVDLPWWVNVVLLGGVLVGRIIPQPTVVVTTTPKEDEDVPLGI